MARNRMLKSGFWDDEKLCTSVSRDARLIFIGLWTHSDDYGVVKGHAIWLRNHILPYDNLSGDEFDKWLSELERGRWIIPFMDDKQKYYYIRKFKEHQIINRPSQNRNPIPPDEILNYKINNGINTDTPSDDSVNTHGRPSDDSVRAHGEPVEGSENNIEEQPSDEKEVKEFHGDTNYRHNPDILSDGSVSAHGGLSGDSVTKEKYKEKYKENIKKETIKEKKSEPSNEVSEFIPPTLEEWIKFGVDYATSYFQFPIDKIACMALLENSHVYWFAEEKPGAKTPWKREKRSDWKRVVQTKIRSESKRLKVWAKDNTIKSKPSDGVYREKGKTYVW